MRRLVWWALIASAVFYLLSNPVGAAGLAHHLGSGIESAARSLSAFVSSL
jgi:hypothetical protein